MALREATLVFLVRRNPTGQVLLGLKKAGFGVGKYDGFGGKVEPGETVEEGAARELFEESSIRVALADLERVAELTFVFPFKPEWSQVVHAFIATQWQGEPAESDEMKPAWFAVDALPYQSMWDDSHYWLPQVLDGRRIRATFTFRDDNETVSAVDLREL